MQLLTTGQLGRAVAGSGVTGLTWGSGTSSPPIDLTHISTPRVGIWLSVEGYFGTSRVSVAVMWKGCYTRTGATYTAFKRWSGLSSTTGNMLIKGARTTGGILANGSYLCTIEPAMPWIRLEAIQTRAGTTNAGIIKWAVCVL